MASHSVDALIDFLEEIPCESTGSLFQPLVETLMADSERPAFPDDLTFLLLGRK